MTERNDGENDRGFLVFGIDPEASDVAQRHDTFQPAVAQFIKSETGPVRAVVSQIGDSVDDHLFVPHDPIPAVRDLLERLGFRRDKAARERKYSRLGTAKIEDIADTIGRLAFQNHQG